MNTKEIEKEIADLIKELRQLDHIKQSTKNRLEMVDPSKIIKAINDQIVWVTDRINELRAEIK